MEKQKTFHKQTGKFIGVIAEHMPEMSSELMQLWIQHPKLLGTILENTLKFNFRTSKSFLKKVGENFRINPLDDTIYSNTAFETLLKEKKDGGPYEHVFVDEECKKWCFSLQKKKPFTAQCHRLSQELYPYYRSLFSQIAFASSRGLYKTYELYEACLLANRVAEGNLLNSGVSVTVFTPHVDLEWNKILTVNVFKHKNAQPSEAPTVTVEYTSFDRKWSSLDSSDSIFVF